MNIDPKKRDDISRFLVHLTRDTDEELAVGNLVNILKNKVIEARTPHCLFKYEFNRLNFSKVLTQKFNSVCFTEAPLHQIKWLTQDISGRNIKMKPYGLVFWKYKLLDLGANPAIYINSKGTNLKKMLLEDFKRQFEGIKLYENLKKEQEDYYDEIIQYYSLVNIIEDKHDFSWEREWRFNGNLKFKYFDLVAIIAEDPELLLKKCSEEIGGKSMNNLRKVPIISPEWNYEEVIESMSCTLWNEFKVLED